MTAAKLLGTFDAVLFDFDGTLGESNDAVLRAYARWAEEYGVEVGYAREYIGRPSATAAHALLAPEIAVEAGLRLDELESSDIDGVVALPGAGEALGAIGDDRHAIVTSCTTRLLTARLAATGLPFPQVIVTCDDVRDGKPAPDSYLLAAERLGVDPARCLVVEDAPAGIAAGRAAGCAVLGILTQLPADVLGADWHAQTLAEVSFIETPDGVTVTLR
ncbi:MAG: HAD-IA family hydrolase [Tessaracoccus sp.]|uniref:HAD family hydrolase n=1 Tax=Tessaracoccus sp. TaxID=1971211 RepID=UPI001EC39B19|nr:HAD-IA family hydrolase [Tessaracoccus sp.]MBK7822423.1 HAD-IA family hydrolase [Tessaracoccus sp.]